VTYIEPIFKGNGLYMLQAASTIVSRYSVNKALPEVAERSMKRIIRDELNQKHFVTRQFIVLSKFCSVHLAGGVPG
jgi:hypothetical protein